MLQGMHLIVHILIIKRTFCNTSAFHNQEAQHGRIPKFQVFPVFFAGTPTSSSTEVQEDPKLFEPR